MPILTDEEADALDDLLTKTVPKTNPSVQGPFIKRRTMMPTPEQRCTARINGMVRREMALSEP